MYINKKIILGTILILALTYFGTTYNNMVAKLWIGNITITDTLTGSAKFNHGIYVDSNIYCDSLYGSGYQLGNGALTMNGIFKNTDLTLLHDGFTKYILTFPNATFLDFIGGVSDVASFDTTKGVNVKSHLTLETVATPTDPADKELKIYVKGAKLIYHYKASTTDYFYYISLTATADQHWIYSATEP